MQTVDLTSLGDEFVIHFGGEFGRINAETFANTLLEVSSAIKEISRAINPDFEIEIYIDALGEGSFRARIRTLSKRATPLIRTAALTIVLGLLTAFIYEKFIADDPDINIYVNDDHYVVESGNQRVILPKEVGEQKEKISKNLELEQRVSNAFEILQKDQDVQNFGIAKDIKDEQLLVNVPRAQFPRLSEVRDIVISQENRRNKYEKTELLIIRAIFERGPRKWQFVWRDGIKISAPILDDMFYDKLASHEYVIGTGDTLRVMLRIHQKKDEMIGAWVNDSYEIVEVLGHSPGPHQKPMFVTTGQVDGA